MLLYLKKLYQREEYQSLLYHQCLRAINIINCAQETASLITELGAAKEKMYIILFQHQGHMNKMDSGYLENYVWIYAHADLNPNVFLWGIWFLCSCDN